MSICGDNVIVINAEKVRMTGKKWTDRVHFSRTLAIQVVNASTRLPLIRSKHPDGLLNTLFAGMLP
jgi:large subunit ribosomal protein L13